MNKEDLRFEIDQLKKDRIIISLQSIACSLAIFLLISFMSVLDQSSSGFVVPAGLVVSVGYWLITIYMNIVKISKIQKLERLLKSMR